MELLVVRAVKLGDTLTKLALVLSKKTCKATDWPELMVTPDPDTPL